MLGGLTKADKPMSLFLRSGDVCVMSGPCRLAYHAVPKILSPIKGSSDFSCFCFKDTQSKDVYKEPTDNCNSCPFTTDSSPSEKTHERRSDGNISSHLASCPEDNSSEPVKMASDHPEDTYASKVCLSSIDTLNRNIIDRLRNMDWNPFSVYLQFSRINLNVRQVFPRGDKRAQLGTVGNTINS